LEKQKLILLPGWGMDAKVWSPVTEVLSEYFVLIYCDWYRVKSVEEYNARVSSVIDKNVDGCFSLLGWSLGSLLAIEAACLYKDRINQLILVSGTSRFTRDKKSGYRCGWPQNVVEKMKSALLHDQQKTLDSFCVSMFSEEEIQQGWPETFAGKPDRNRGTYETQELLAGLDFLIQADYREKLNEIEAPVLMIHGEKDTICPVSASEYISSQLKGDVFLKIMKGVGHIPFHTGMEEFNGLLKGFITRGKT